MKLVRVDEERCKSCKICIEACPKKIIQISKDRMNGKGYRPAEVAKPEECIGCAFCATVCPDCAITVEED